MKYINKIRKAMAYCIVRDSVQFNFTQPIISITFDDFPKSALSVGGAILKSEGIVGTFYASFGLSETMTSVGLIGTLSEMADCKIQGHEIACHTYDHLNMADSNPSDIENSIIKNQRKALEINNLRFEHFAYPYGDFNLTAKNIAMRHYKSARSCIRGINKGKIDLGLLKSVPLQSMYGLDGWLSYFNQLKTKPGWLIFTLHDVSDHPSPYGCTPEQLKYLIHLSREENFQILPVGAVVNSLLMSRS